jgi:hypothetical protein
MYAETDEPNFTAHFGRGLRAAEGAKGSIANALVGALGLYEFAYNGILDAMPEFLAELQREIGQRI